MAFHWLPDAELDPHPRLTWFAECGFDLVVSTFYRVNALYPSDYRLAPGTLVVSNHLRDADVPILTSALCRRKGFRMQWPMPFFASREDLFRRGFLAEQLHAWPRPIRLVLGRIPLTRLFRVMRAEPIRRVREFTLAEAFAELPATDDTACWLNERGRCETAAASNSPVRAGNDPPGRRDWGLRRLHHQARQLLAPDFRATVSAHLDRFAGLLDTGRIVYLAPEGRNSRDGRFGRIRDGAWRLVQRAAAPPPILPLALSYDRLRAGRLRVVVNIGTPLETYEATARRGFDSMLQMQIRKLYPLNASHLASRFLVSGPAAFTTADFADWLEHARARLVAAGVTLDPELARGDTLAVAGQRLNWLRRKAQVARTRGGWRNQWPGDAPAGWGRPAHVVRYCDNALDDHLAALAPDLTLSP